MSMVCVPLLISNFSGVRVAIALLLLVLLSPFLWLLQMSFKTNDQILQVQPRLIFAPNYWLSAPAEACRDFSDHRLDAVPRIFRPVIGDFLFSINQLVGESSRRRLPSSG